MNSSLTSDLNVKFGSRTAPSVDLISQHGQFRISNTYGSKYGYDNFYLTEIGPGFFPGESHRIRLEISPTRQIRLRQQAANKVMTSYKSPKSEINFTVKIGAEASLIFLAQPIILMPSSALLSSSEITLEKGGRLIFSDIIGAVPTLLGGFIDKPRHLCTQVRLYIENQLIFLDSTLAESNELATFDENWSRLFGVGMTCGTLYLVGYQFRQIKNALDDLRTSTFQYDTQAAICEPDENVTLIRAKTKNTQNLLDFFETISNTLCLKC